MFIHSGKTYKYDFNLLTVEQAELAREAGEFKYNQLQNEPESFKQVIKSRGAEWLSIVLSYLLREVKDDIVQPFNKDKAESEVETFIKNLPISYLNDLRECVTDFFSGIGKKPLILANLQGEKKRSGIEILLPILQKTMQGSLNQDV
ncbi:MAG TPA: hypothetical protein PKV40_06520 [Candidatus Kapabacteria bacterium]|nr:hypothetical protein [Candidatus Kapabacteria bacterium]